MDESEVYTLSQAISRVINAPHNASLIELDRELSESEMGNILEEVLNHPGVVHDLMTNYELFLDVDYDGLGRQMGLFIYWMTRDTNANKGLHVSGAMSSGFHIAERLTENLRDIVGGLILEVIENGGWKIETD